MEMPPVVAVMRAGSVRAAFARVLISPVADTGQEASPVPAVLVPDPACLGRLPLPGLAAESLAAAPLGQVKV